MSFSPFNPLERAAQMEKLVMKENARAYYRVRYAERFDCPVTVDSVGCCLQCAYCWNALRNENMELAVAKAKFYSPESIAEKAIALARANKEWRFRISGCETILGEASTRHFTEFIQEVLKTPKGKKEAFFLLETNGIVLGSNEHLVKMLEPFKECLAVRVAVKGEDAKQFEKLSGAKAEFFGLQKKALDYCYKHDIPSKPAIMDTFMSVDKLSPYLGIHPEDFDQEHLKFYPITKKSLIDRGCWEMRKVKA